MSTIIVIVNIQFGQGDVSINIFNDEVTYEHYFSTNGIWNCDLSPGHYLVGIAGTCPSGGNLSINFQGIKNCTPTPPLLINKSGPFLISATINV